ncbi:nucleotide sugar dehydrogenase [Candidatus Woesearchaeota archaeon]|nr:nucleotide sugar dehydrogenase [Candidatus Woesearchaeota archaeon]
MTKISIVGLGYVGFPLAVLCKQKGFDVFGFDKDPVKIDKISKGIDPVEGGNFKDVFESSNTDSTPLQTSNVIIICVPTPVDETKMPDLRPVISAVSLVKENIKNNKPLVVVESTINPGVMEEIVKPIFDKEGFIVGKDYFLAHCPERINPGDPKWNVGNIPRVVGAFTTEGLEKAYEFYTNIISGEVVKMSNIRAAEATKILENSFRDINIAFINEIAKSFEVLDIDVVEVIRGASTKPFAFMPHYPGCGVGGHCIPVDPYYLIEKAKSKGFDHKFLRNARTINESMPGHTVNLLQDALNEDKRALNGTIVGLLGLSYKANVGDLRESPSLVIKKFLEKKGAKVITFDPYIKSDVDSLKELQNKTDTILLATNHDAFKNIDFSKVKVFVDGRNMFHDNIPNCIYKGIGVHGK